VDAPTKLALIFGGVGLFALVVGIATVSPLASIIVLGCVLIIVAITFACIAIERNNW
jgi:uncharacterized membrane protein YidH (DUF202 family)